MQSNDKALMLSTAAWLNACARLRYVSILMTAFTFLLLLGIAGTTRFYTICGVLAVIVLLEAYWSLRLRFDANLFESWSKNPDLKLSDLDDGLTVLGFKLKSSSDAGAARDLPSRIAGAKALSIRYITLIGIQALIVLLLLIFFLVLI